ncbi:MAG: S-layer homology domain-containing protein [Ruminococcaceae bacterium]|nr:S-layer homology domain-containing protein [Oscillospiraceae bacterium]
MKRFLSFTLMLTMLLQFLPVVSGAVFPFVDVAPDAYYASAVEWAVEKGITSGTSATTFSPKMVCTRSQAVQFLWNAAGNPEPTTTNNLFKDVKSNAWYYKAVLWAVENGITNGTSATTFAPDMKCSRSQIVTLLWRTMGSPEITADNPFSDVPSNAYYLKPVLWAVEKGITSGTGGSKFSPLMSCSRSQIVTFLYRCFKEETPLPHEHSFGEWEIETPATCNAEGKEIRKCSGCDETESRAIPKVTEHSYGEWSVTTPADCYNEGVETRKCTTCDETETKTIEKTTHKWSAAWMISIPPTCTTEGTEIKTCSYCTDVRSRAVAATGHAWGGWTVTTPATESSDGVETRVCGNCGETETRSIPSLAPALVITTQPADTNATPGEIVKFKVVVSEGTVPYTYQWQYKIKGGDFENIEAAFTWAYGENKKNLEITVDSDQILYERVFRCVITDAAGKTVTSNEAGIAVTYDKLVVTIQPNDAVLESGQMAVFTAMAGNGIAPISVKWQYKIGDDGAWTDFTESDNTWAQGYDTWDLIIDPATAGSENDYRFRCVFTDYTGDTVTTKEVKCSVYKHLSIKTQPEESNYVTDGDSVTLTVAVTDGLPSYYYRWYFRMDGMPIFAEITEADSWASGCNSSDLNITPTQDMLDSNLRVYCKISDEYGDEVDSNVCYVIRRLEITYHTEEMYAEDGDLVTFSVGVVGGVKDYTYQWFMVSDIESAAPVSEKETKSLQNHDFTTYLFADDFNYNAKYYCVIEDSTGYKVTTPYILVKENPSISIKTQPSNANGVLVGEEVTFRTVVFGGTAPYIYQWQALVGKNYIDITTAGNGDFGPIYSGYNTDTLAVVCSGKAFFETQFRCVITDAKGKSVTTKAVKMTASPMSIASYTTEIEAYPGDMATFSVSVNGGIGPYSYQLQVKYDGTSFTDYDSPILTYGNGYFNKEITAVMLENNVEFRCVVTDVTGASVTTGNINIIEIEPLVITSQTPSDIGIDTNSTLYLSVSVSGGLEPYTYRWLYKNDAMTYESEVGTNNALCQVTTSEIDCQYHGYYRCIITDAKGHVVESDPIYFNFALHVRKQTESVTVNVGEKAFFSVTACGGVAPYRYSWEVYNAKTNRWEDVSSAMSGRTTGYSSSIMSFNLASSDCGTFTKFRCYIKDSRGIDIISEDIPLKVPFSIASQPKNVVAVKGSNFTFKGLEVVGGEGTLKYTWQYAYTRDNPSSFSNCFLSPAYFKGYDTNELTVYFNSGFEKGTFRCKIEDEVGNVIYSDYVYVNLP